MKKHVSITLAAIAGTALALSAPTAASAHVSADASSTAAGSYTVVTFSVPHGCEESPTQVVTIDIPESIASVTPTVNPSWTVERVFDESSEQVTQVVYTSTTGGLPSDLRDTFALSLKLPEGEAGDTVEFPVTQTCTEGSVEWVGDEVPLVTLTAATDDDHSHGAGDDHSGDDHSTDDAHSTDAGSAAAQGDVLARVLGVVGVIVGIVGVVLAVLARRATATKA
ncbi:MAG: sortase [Microbacterium sp.]|nr:sortase [Microbacterium sp.]MBA4345950.1 sortase [Microbacterium sp.]